jgi:hypothetical protein
MTSKKNPGGSGMTSQKKRHQKWLLSKARRIELLITECHIAAGMHMDRELNQICKELDKASERMLEHIRCGELYPLTLTHPPGEMIVVFTKETGWTVDHT